VQLRFLLRALADDGVCVLISSHVLADLEEVADHVVVVDCGRTVAEHRLSALPVARGRRWRIRSLDTGRLQQALSDAGTPADLLPAGAELVLEDDQAAADLLARLVRDGVPVLSFAPVSGALEAAYLADVTEAS
jgi:ABC-2 type transport system ATP-binding protein